MQQSASNSESPRITSEISSAGKPGVTSSLRLEWQSPNELAENPLNWRRHPAEQINALTDVIADVGWAGACLYNERTGRLIDGHARRKTAIDQGTELIPVLVGSWDEEQEKKILATLDPLAAMAAADEQKVNELLAGLEFESRAVDELAAQVAAQAAEPFRVEYAAVGNLKPHPRNYREHPPDQVAHLAASLKQTGFTRPVLAAWDDTILAGHGIVLAARSLGKDVVPVRRLDLDPNDPRALRVLAADNETGGAALVNDRLLSQLLREVGDSAPGGLEGTGFDREKLNALAYASRPPDQVGGKDPSSEWAGMPEYDPGSDGFRLVVTFPSKEDRDRFVAGSGLVVTQGGGGRTASAPWPPRVRGENVDRFEPEGIDDGDGDEPAPVPDLHSVEGSV
jgi:ParB-like chromosome segregation protein Spo0J